MNRTTLVASSFLLASLLGPRAAQAQSQVYSEIYSDAKEVIEDLISREVAHSVVPGLACFSPKGLMLYYPKTLQHAYSRQFGNIRSSLREESAELIANYLFLSFGNALAAPPKPPPPLESFLGIVSFYDDEGAVKKYSSKLEGLRDEATKENDNNKSKLYQSTLDQIATARSTNAATKHAYDTCVEGMRRDGPERVIAHSGLQAPLSSNCDVAAATKNLDTKMACGIAKASHDLLLGHAESAQEELLQIIAFFLAEKEAQVSQITRDASDKEIEDMLVSVRQALVQNTPPAVPLSPEVMQLVERARNQWSMATGGGKKSLDLLAFIDIFLGPSGVVTAVCESPSRPVLVSMCQYSKFARDHLRQGGSLRNIAQAIKKQDARAIANLVLQEGFQRFECGEKDEDDCIYDFTEKFGRFASSFVSYVLDAQEGEKIQQVARQAMIDSTEELIEALGLPQSNGFRRSYGKEFILPTPSLKLSWNNGYLNQSGSDGFRYTASLDWFNIRLFQRYRETSFVSLRLSVFDPLAPLAELALRASTDAATKKTILYDNNNLVWLNGIAPHLDFLVGSPVLSRHVALFAGLSLRAAVPFSYDVNANNGTERKVAYYTPFSRSNFKDDSQLDVTSYTFLSRFVEIGVGVKYMP